MGPHETEAEGDYTYTHIHTHTHTYRHIHTHTHTHTQFNLLPTSTLPLPRISLKVPQGVSSDSSKVLWITLGVLRGFPGAKRERICLQCWRGRRHGFDPWVRKMPQRRAWQPTPVFFPGKSHGERSLAGHGPWVRRESDTAEWVGTAQAGVLSRGERVESSVLLLFDKLRCRSQGTQTRENRGSLVLMPSVQ